MTAAELPEEREAELEKLAKAIIGGSVFGTWSFSSKDECERMLPLVFMPLSFMTKKEAESLKGVAHIYEYAEKAGPRSINGYPIFYGFNVVTSDEWSRTLAKVKAMNDALEATRNPAP